MLTEQMLKRITPNCPQKKRQEICNILNDICEDYGIINERRISAFLATVAVESAEFRYQEEIASGSAYEGRRDLGNTVPGDGKRFKGRGRIQITGRFNYKAYTDYLRQSKHLPFIDFIKEPQKLAQEPYATDSACWFFAVKIKANQLADKREFLTIQTRVNGRNRKTGLPNHWTERKRYYERALQVLPDNFVIQKIEREIPPVIQEEILADDTVADFVEVPQLATETEINDEVLDIPQVEQFNPINSFVPNVQEVLQQPQTIINQVQETVEESKNFDAFIPQIDTAKKTLAGLGILSGLGFGGSISSFFAGIPEWVVISLVVFFGLVILTLIIGTIVVFVKYHQDIFGYAKNMNTLRADKDKHNPILTTGK